MNKPYVPYELAIFLKEKGFNLSCIYHYKISQKFPNQTSKIPTFEMTNPFGRNHNSLETRASAPLWSEVCDWIYSKSETNVVVNYSPAYTLETMVDEVKNALKRW